MKAGNSNAVPLAPPVMVRVTAPSSLEEGYTFDAVFNGEVFPVIVPRGGVKAGQVFEVPFLPVVEAVAVPIGQPLELPQSNGNSLGEHPLSSESTPMLQPLVTPPNQSTGGGNHQEAPLGSWKTHWFDCLSEGCCHPSLCNAIFFPQILMGQVLTRMKLNCCGLPEGQASKYSTRIWIILTIVLLYQRMRFSGCLSEPSTSVWWSTVEDIADDLDDDDDDDTISFQGFRQHVHDIDANRSKGNTSCTSDQADTLRTINWIWFWSTVMVLTRLRKAVRNAHGISREILCEDCCCAVFCGCCTVAQLARQTANYKVQRAYCCTGTGLADGWFGHRQEELERRHQEGHHLVHAHSCEQAGHFAQHQRQHQQHIV